MFFHAESLQFLFTYVTSFMIHKKMACINVLEKSGFGNFLEGKILLLNYDFGIVRWKNIFPRISNTVGVDRHISFYLPSQGGQAMMHKLLFKPIAKKILYNRLKVGVGLIGRFGIRPQLELIYFLQDDPILIAQEDLKFRCDVEMPTVIGN